ncbi:MAG: Maf family protein [Alphaproteobacteria bacterium]
MTGERIILASASASRAAILEGAGLAVERVPAAIDESEVKEAFAAEGRPAGDVAQTLAELKARRVAAHNPDALVIGADQMLVCGNTWFDKPVDRDAARRQLLSLRGRMHELLAAVCVVQGESVIWQHLDRARMTVRPFGDAFLDWYLDRAGDRVCQSVGAYQLEGLGSHLFARIEGDYFTILGLPLLPLLDFLRGRGALPE